MNNPTEERLVQMLDIPLIDEPKNSDVRLTSPSEFLRRRLHCRYSTEKQSSYGGKNELAALDASLQTWVKFGRRNIIRQFMNSKTTEIQFRALKEGEVGTETAIELISRD